jgi:rhodanese-related sulfurtransferase
MNLLKWLQKVLTSRQNISIDEVKTEIEKDAVLLDTRQPGEFVKGFIPGAIGIGLDGRFAEWAGSLLSFEKPIVIVTDKGDEKETLIRLARVGFDNVIGYVGGGIEAWSNAGEELDLIIDVEADELGMDLPFDKNLVVLDVRKPVEYAEGHVKDAVNLPLSDLNDPLNMAAIEDGQNVYIHCGSGYRSVIAASLFKRQGIHNVRNVVGGWNEIKKQKNIPVEKDKAVLN